VSRLLVAQIYIIYYRILFIPVPFNVALPTAELQHQDVLLTARTRIYHTAQNIASTRISPSVKLATCVTIYIRLTLRS
jgi:hypothetical protein